MVLSLADLSDGRGTGLFTEGVGQIHQMIQLALKREQAVMIGSGIGVGWFSAC